MTPKDTSQTIDGDKGGFSSNYQFTEVVADFYGELEDFILVRLEQGKVQVRKTVQPTNKNIKVNDDNTISPIDASKPSAFATPQSKDNRS